MATTETKAQTIAKFHLYIDDMTDLSEAEESALYDKIYGKICRKRVWEILKKAHTTTQSTTVPYIALPSDFSFLVQNANNTESSYEAQRPVVFVGSSYTPYKVVSFSDRRQYRNQDGYCYIDAANNLLYFTLQPASAQSIEFDYHYVPAALSLSGTPVFPDPIGDAIYHGMCVDDNIIQQSDKAKRYLEENQAMYDAFVKDLEFWNSNLIQL